MAAAAKLGLFLYWMEGPDREALFERIRAADDAGAHSVWVSEGAGPDCFTTMARIVERTSRIQVGSSIVNVFSRTPAALAQHFATLDEASGGRMLIGLGAGRPAVVERFHGIPFREPLRRLRECVEIIRLLLAGEPAKYAGRIYQLDHDAGLDLEPVRQRVPIYIGSLAPASIEQTAAIGDGWLPAWTPVEDLPELIRRFRGQAAGAGRSPESLCVRSPGTILFTKRVQEGRRKVARALATYVAARGEIYYRHLSRLGHRDAGDRIREAWRAGGVQAASQAVPPALQQSIGLVTDSIGEARERIAREAEAGVDLHCVEVQGGSPREMGEALDALSRR